MSDLTTPKRYLTLFPKINGKHSEYIYLINRLHTTNISYRKITTLQLKGTVKLHGTHADIVIHGPSDTITFQSRNRRISPETDNGGFAAALGGLKPKILRLKKKIAERWAEETRKKPEEIVIAGEWIGPGIQKKVAINSLPNKLFVILSISINRIWQPTDTYSDIADESVGIVNVCHGGIFSEALDLENLEASLQRLQKVADQVEKECPFAGKFGIVGQGEGVVWRPEGVLDEDPKFWFKTKGQVFTNRPIPAKELAGKDGKEKAQLFARNVVNEIRLQQGWDYLEEMGIERIKGNVAVYLRWLMGDVEVEERRDIDEANLERAMLKKEVDWIGKNWYFKKIANLEKE